MCVHPNTPDYDTCVYELAELTSLIANGQATARDWIQRGTHLQQMGEIPGAIRDFHRALARRAELSVEQLAYLYAMRGVCYRRSNMFEQAVADLQQAVTLTPQIGHYWSCLGIALFYKGEFEQAIVELTHALELEPTNERSWETRAKSYQALSQHEAALADFDHRVAMDIPVEPLTYTRRAYSHLLLGRYEAVIADCDRAERLDTHGNTIDIHRMRGHARFALGNAAAALGDFSRALALQPDLAELYLWRGQVYRALGDQETAVDELMEYAKRRAGGADQPTHTIADLFAGAALAPDELSALAH
jgi:tetratricopeptide (TPR) repeat protein